MYFYTSCSHNGPRQSGSPDRHGACRVRFPVKKLHQLQPLHSPQIDEHSYFDSQIFNFLSSNYLWAK